MLALLAGLLLDVATATTNVSEPWGTLVETLLKHSELGPFNLQVGDVGGLLANITFGDWSSSKVVEPIFSASKLASGALFFALDAEGVLPLDSKVSDHLEWWSANASDQRSLVTMQHLLNFTSGLGEGDCVNSPTQTWEACTRQLYNETFNASMFGKAVYNEGHLHVAQTIALKVTNAEDWSDLWYDKVGKPAGLPQAKYYTFPSQAHAAGGSGMSTSSDHYAMFLSSFHRSLYSSDRPTTPLKMGESMGFGRGFFGAGVPVADLPTESYAHTSWRQASGFIHSLGCFGWLPGVFPSTEDQAGWWMLLARAGSAHACFGALQVHAVTSELVREIGAAVRAHRAAAEQAPFHALHSEAVCTRAEEVVNRFCECPGANCIEDELQLCNREVLSKAACTPPHSSWLPEALALCAKCGNDEKNNETHETSRASVSSSRVGSLLLAACAGLLIH